MRSSKNRSRSKSNRQRSLGNIVNRVFDSSGPESKVRGTPQQIIEKYLMLARDAQLSNDRVAEQNFLQHAEHYTRMLSEAQREMAREQEGRQGQPGQGQPGQSDANGSFAGYAQEGNGGNGSPGHAGASPGDRDRDRGAERGSERGSERPNDRPGHPRNRPDDRGDEQPRGDFRAQRSVMMPALNLEGDDDGPGLVETPETRPDARSAPAPSESAAQATPPPSGRTAPRGPRKPRATPVKTATEPTVPGDRAGSDATD